MSHQVENKAPDIVLGVNKAHNHISAYSSFSVFSYLAGWKQAHSVWMKPIWYHGPYPPTLWRGRHLTQHQRLHRKNEKGEGEEWGDKLRGISRHETRGQMQHHHHPLPKSILGSEWTNDDIMWMIKLFFQSLKACYKVTPNLKRTLEQLCLRNFDLPLPLVCCSERPSFHGAVPAALSTGRLVWSAGATVAQTRFWVNNPRAWDMSVFEVWLFGFASWA